MPARNMLPGIALPTGLHLVKTIMITLCRATVFCLIYVNSMYMYRKAFTRRQEWAHFVQGLLGQ